jgi:hypothetical protein
MKDFLPTQYELPETESNYLKLKKGSNKFRVLSSAIVGFEYWTRENKPVRSKVAWEEIPDDAKLDKNGNFQKHFWAFTVYDYESKKVKILELTQKTIMGSIKTYVSNPKWGNPTGYDFEVTRTGDGMETEYTTIAEPHSDTPVTNIPEIHLEELFVGGDPFSKE